MQIEFYPLFFFFVFHSQQDALQKAMTMITAMFRGLEVLFERVLFSAAKDR